MARTHAGRDRRPHELVGRLLAFLDAERPVARFLDSYAAKFDRPGVNTQPIRYRELLATLRREALLVMVSHSIFQLPVHLVQKRKAGLTSDEVRAVRGFAQQILLSLAKMQRWNAFDASEFHRDLDLYQQIAARRPQPTGRRRVDQSPQGAFADRCALLLDPGLLEQARTAAGEFQRELEGITEHLLRSVFCPPAAG